MPLLIQSLSLPELSLKTSTLSTLCSLVRDAPLIISQHLTSLMPSLLSLAQQPQQMVIKQCGTQGCYLCCITCILESEDISFAVPRFNDSSSTSPGLLFYDYVLGI